MGWQFRCSPHAAVAELVKDGGFPLKDLMLLDHMVLSNICKISGTIKNLIKPWKDLVLPLQILAVLKEELNPEKTTEKLTELDYINKDIKKDTLTLFSLNHDRNSFLLRARSSKSWLRP